MNEPLLNTDKEIWRQIPDDYYSPSIHTTEQNNIGINVGGTVYVKSVEEWHKFGDKLEALRNVHEIQGQKGNWDYDQYMLGLYNGLELALSIMENREPQYRESTND
jgi:hypothetical protein